MTRVLAFGAFDPLHEGHREFLRQAKELGDHLAVVVARDSSVRHHKGREPRMPEQDRLERVRSIEWVDEAVLGRKSADPYHILGEMDFDVLALGYSQEPSEEEVREELQKRGKGNVEVVRLEPYHQDLYPPD